MAEKICGLGFDCAGMMLCPGIDPGDCENYAACGAAKKLSPEEEFEIRVRRERFSVIEEEILHLNRHEAAIMMLMQRGNPQSAESLGIVAVIGEAETKISELKEQLAQLEAYIAPVGCEAHRYNVRRGAVRFWYNKLTAKIAMFAPAAKEHQVKVIHLSHDIDPRNFEGRRGIERRNALLQAKTQLNTAVAALESAVELVRVLANRGEE